MFFDETDFSQIDFKDDNDLEDRLNIGDVIYYDPVSFSFSYASENHIISPEYLKNWNVIMIGIIIDVHSDNTVDILMSGFLMSEPLRLPAMYYHKEKRKYIRNYAKDMFRRYVSAFFKQCPGYEDLLKLDITMPTLDNLYTIYQNKDTIFDEIRKCSDSNNLKTFLSRLFNNYLYATHKELMYMVKYVDGSDKPEIIIPDAKRADFLCVFRNVNLFGSLMDIDVEDKEEYFEQNIDIKESND